MDDICSQLINAASACLEESKKTPDLDAKLDYLKMATEMTKTVNMVKSEENKEKARISDHKWEMAALVTKLVAFITQTLLMTGFETGHIKTFSATKGIEGNLRLPSIW